MALGCSASNVIRFVDLACCPLPPLAFASGDWVNPRSALLLVGDFNADQQQFVCDI
jgi:hypothetical protein